MQNNKTSSSYVIKKVLCVVIFLALAACMSAYLFRVFDAPTETQKTINQFYREEPNTLDGIYIGTSATYRYWIPTQAYEDYGMCVFNFGSPSQSVSMAQFIIEDALKTQPDMKTILIELRNMKRGGVSFLEADFRRITDNMPFSTTRIRAINYTLDYYKAMGADINYNKLDYYLPFTVYHSRWNDKDEIGWYDLTAPKETVIYKGYWLTGSFGKVKVEEPEEYTGKDKLYEPIEDVLKDLLAYCQTIDNEVIFVVAPFKNPDQAYGRINTAAEMCTDAGFKVWDFNREPYKSRLDMDWDNDFYNDSHANIWGAQKYTKCLSQMLHEECDIEDHRGQKGYESWDEAMKVFDERLVDEGIEKVN